MRPTRRLNGYFRSHPGQAAGILGLAGGGVCHAKTVTDFAVRSYRTISPLPPALILRINFRIPSKVFLQIKLQPSL